MVAVGSGAHGTAGLTKRGALGENGSRGGLAVANSGRHDLIMSANNCNWVCFDCRTALRYPKISSRVPVCPGCGADCFCLGYKVEVPRGSAVRAWRQLREECRRRLHVAAVWQKRRRVRWQHDLEKEIIRLERVGANKDRARQIKKLKFELETSLT